MIGMEHWTILVNSFFVAREDGILKSKGKRVLCIPIQCKMSHVYDVQIKQFLSNWARRCLYMQLPPLLLRDHRHMSSLD